MIPTPRAMNLLQELDALEWLAKNDPKGRHRSKAETIELHIQIAVDEAMQDLLSTKLIRSVKPTLPAQPSSRGPWREDVPYVINPPKRKREEEMISPSQLTTPATNPQPKILRSNGAKGTGEPKQIVSEASATVIHVDHLDVAYGAVVAYKDSKNVFCLTSLNDGSKVWSSITSGWMSEPFDSFANACSDAIRHGNQPMYFSNPSDFGKWLQESFPQF